MLSPLPVLLVWLASVSPRGEGGIIETVLRGLEGGVSRFDGAMAFFCVTLGLSTALFIRLRQRYLKAGAILAAGIVGGAMAVSAIQGGLDLFSILAVSLALLAFLVLPYILHAFLDRGSRPKQA